MLSGIRWQKCASCPRTFAVLTESERRECLRCEQKRKRLKHRHKQSKLGHGSKSRLEMDVPTWATEATYPETPAARKTLSSGCPRARARGQFGVFGPGVASPCAVPGGDL